MKIFQDPFGPIWTKNIAWSDFDFFFAEKSTKANPFRENAATQRAWGRCGAAHVRRPFFFTYLGPIQISENKICCLLPIRILFFPFTYSVPFFSSPFRILFFSFFFFLPLWILFFSVCLFGSVFFFCFFLPSWISFFVFLQYLFGSSE